MPEMSPTQSAPAPLCNSAIEECRDYLAKALLRGDTPSIGRALLLIKNAGLEKDLTDELLGLVASPGDQDLKREAALMLTKVKDISDEVNFWRLSEIYKEHYSSDVRASLSSILLNWPDKEKAADHALEAIQDRNQDINSAALSYLLKNRPGVDKLLNVITLPDFGRCLDSNSSIELVSLISDYGKEAWRAIPLLSRWAENGEICVSVQALLAIPKITPAGKERTSADILAKTLKRNFSPKQDSRHIESYALEALDKLETSLDAFLPEIFEQLGAAGLTPICALEVLDRRGYLDNFCWPELLNGYRNSIKHPSSDPGGSFFSASSTEAMIRELCAECQPVTAHFSSLMKHALMCHCPATGGQWYLLKSKTEEKKTFEELAAETLLVDFSRENAGSRVDIVLRALSRFKTKTEQLSFTKEMCCYLRCMGKEANPFLEALSEKLENGDFSINFPALAMVCLSGIRSAKTAANIDRAVGGQDSNLAYPAMRFIEAAGAQLFPLPEFAKLICSCAMGEFNFAEGGARPLDCRVSAVKALSNLADPNEEVINTLTFLLFSDIEPLKNAAKAALAKLDGGEASPVR